MTAASESERILDDPAFAHLVRRRRAFAWSLAALLLSVFFGFILLVAFAPQWLGAPLAPGLTTSVGIPVGVGIILFAFLLTGLYVRRANREFDRRVSDILEHSRRP